MVRNHISFSYLEKHLLAQNPNGIGSFLKSKNVTCAEDLGNLDDIEARHVLDMIIMYSGLNEMRVHEVQ